VCILAVSIVERSIAAETTVALLADFIVAKSFLGEYIVADFIFAESVVLGYIVAGSIVRVIFPCCGVDCCEVHFR